MGVKELKGELPWTHLRDWAVSFPGQVFLIDAANILFWCALARYLSQGSPLARANHADMQQSEEYELPRGEHSVAQGPAEQPALPPAEQPVLFSSTDFEELRVHLPHLRTQKHVLSPAASPHQPPW